MSRFWLSSCTILTLSSYCLNTHIIRTTGLAPSTLPARCISRQSLTHLLASLTSTLTLSLFSSRSSKVQVKKKTNNWETSWKLIQISLKATCGRFQYLRYVWVRTLSSCIILYSRRSWFAWHFTVLKELQIIYNHMCTLTPTSRLSSSTKTELSFLESLSLMTSKATSLKWSRKTKESNLWMNRKNCLRMERIRKEESVDQTHKVLNPDTSTTQKLRSNHELEPMSSHNRLK